MLSFLFFKNNETVVMLISWLSLQQNPYKTITVVVVVVSWLLLNVEEEEPNPLRLLK